MTKAEIGLQQFRFLISLQATDLKGKSPKIFVTNFDNLPLVFIYLNLDYYKIKAE